MYLKPDQSFPFIVVTSDEPWGDIWHTQLHYAFQLSKNTNVVFLGPPKPWKWHNLLNVHIQVNEISKTLHVIDYFNFLPSALGKIALYINDKINGYLLTKYLPKVNVNQNGIIWHFDRYRSFYLFRNNQFVKHIYHVIDPCINLNLDVELSKTSNLVVITSNKFISHYKKLNKNVIQIGQGIDSDFLLNSNHDTPNDKLVSYNSILLLGTISDDVDFDLLLELKAGISSNLCIIGPDNLKLEVNISKFSKLLNTKGVFWLGSMPPDQFREHILACKVGIIAYKTQGREWNSLRSPLKVISFLALKKPIVSTIDCEIPSLVNNAIYIQQSPDKFISDIELIFKGNISVDNIRIDNFLDSISYNKLIAEIIRNLG